MANTEWWQRGPIDGVPAALQPVAHILLQVRESASELVEHLTIEQWNARPAGVAAAAFHVRHMAGVIDRLFTYARGESLAEGQFAALRAENADVTQADIATILKALSDRVDLALDQLRSTDPATLGDYRAVGRAQLPSTVIGCLVHGAEHAMRHVGQLSVTVRIAAAAILFGITVSAGAQPAPPAKWKADRQNPYSRLFETSTLQRSAQAPTLPLPSSLPPAEKCETAIAPDRVAVDARLAKQLKESKMRFTMRSVTPNCR